LNESVLRFRRLIAGNIRVDWKKRAPSVLLFVLGFILIGLLINTAAARYRIGVGFSQSLPFDFYLIKLGEMPRKNDYVAFIMDKPNPYYKPGIQFGKRVSGISGDVLTVKGRDYYINGMFVASAMTTDTKKRPVGQFLPTLDEHGNTVIPEGRFFVLTDHPMSYDSRYWGYLEKEKILGKMIPIF